jgi:phosphoserine phosphatase
MTSRDFTATANGTAIVQDDSGTRAAIVYDFDGTLAQGNIQEHSLIPELLGLGVDEFWAEVGREKRTHDADEILIYMRLMLEKARARGIAITRELLREHGSAAPLFPGLDTWFSRINAHARERGLCLEHYVISSGNEEMIRGCSIVGNFRKVFASRFVYDQQGHASWPAVAINYTTKTQFLFRINKGVDNSWDNEAVNRWQPMNQRRVPFTRMIFIGDGETDIPCMKMVRHQGGYSIAVYDRAKWESAQDSELRQKAQERVFRLIAEDRVHFVAAGDYRDGSQLEITVKGILGRIAVATAAGG